LSGAVNSEVVILEGAGGLGGPLGEQVGSLPSTGAEEAGGVAHSWIQKLSLGDAAEKSNLSDAARPEGPLSDEPPAVASTAGDSIPDDSLLGAEPSTSRRLQATPLEERPEGGTRIPGRNVTGRWGARPKGEPQPRPGRRGTEDSEMEGPSPTLDAEAEELARRLRASAAQPPENRPRAEAGRPLSRSVTGLPQSTVDTNPAHRTTETSAARLQDETISAVQATSDAGQADRAPKASRSKRRSNVSRETLELGGRTDGVGEDKVMEDEAAIAVRKAALRAAAQVARTSRAGQQDGAAMDSRDHVSRETLASQADVQEGGVQAGRANGPAESQTETSHGIDREQAARDARVTFRITHGGYSRFAVAVANQKGGVGKSTTAVNLGAYLALAGARVLVVDLDPQGNASTGLGLDHRRIEPSVYDVLTGEAEAASAIRQTAVNNLDILPSTIDLAGAEVELVNALSRETRLRQALGTVRYGYDVVFIDCPPSLGLLTVNALAAADELLIPIQCEYYALEGLGQLLRNVDLVRVNLNPGLHIGGIVLTMYDGRTRLAEQVVQEVRKHFSDLVYQTVVPRSVRLSEAPGYGVPIALYDPLSRGGIAYRDLAFELADRTGLLAPTQEGAS